MASSATRSTYAVAAMVMTSAVVGAGTVEGARGPVVPSPERCAQVADGSIEDTTITSAQHVPASAEVPAHCRVDGYVTTPGNDSVASNEVNFAVGLPDDWNHHFLFLGIGGLAGHITALDPGLERGYATATTDTGHEGAGPIHPELDGSWALENRPAQIDYAYRGTHVATVAAKAVTESYYELQPEHSIISGCSNGGRQGLMEAQRYPDDYDAVVADSPALAVADLFTSWIWQQQAQLATPDAWLSPEKLPALAEVSAAAAVEQGAVFDGVIGDPRNIPVDDTQLDAAGLTVAEATTAMAIYDGPTTSSGDQLVSGHPIGHEELWARYITGAVAPEADVDGQLGWPLSADAPAAYTFLNEFLRYFYFSDPNYDVTDFDLDDDLNVIEAFVPRLDATDPDLTAFQARGGKLLVIQGWHDPAVNAQMIVDYYQEVGESMGTATRDEFFRLYMAGGRGHCGGGPGPDAVDALAVMEQWLADGEPPELITGTNSESDRILPLCPHPTVARQADAGTAECILAR